jgi:hypothetical protein
MPKSLQVYRSEWHRVLVSGRSQRHYYVSRETGVLTCRLYGEHAIRPDPDRIQHLDPEEVREATVRASNWLAEQGLPATIRYEAPPDA